RQNRPSIRCSAGAAGVADDSAEASLGLRRLRRVDDADPVVLRVRRRRAGSTSRAARGGNPRYACLDPLHSAETIHSRASRTIRDAVLSSGSAPRVRGASADALALSLPATQNGIRVRPLLRGACDGDDVLRPPLLRVRTSRRGIPRTTKPLAEAREENRL